MSATTLRSTFSKQNDNNSNTRSNNINNNNNVGSINSNSTTTKSNFNRNSKISSTGNFNKEGSHSSKIMVDKLKPSHKMNGGKLNTHKNRSKGNDKSLNSDSGSNQTNSSCGGSDEQSSGMYDVKNKQDSVIVT